ncbi:MAG: hypothetical protein ABI577_17650 [bacterium]
MSDHWHDPANPQAPNPGRWKTCVIGCGLFAGIVLAWLVIYPGVLLAAMFWDSRPPSQVDFDASLWRDSPGQEIRWRMHEDLLTDGTLEGKTVADVEAVLGPGCDCGYSYFGALAYNMGPEHGPFAIDSVWLVVYFGPDGIFQRALVVTD